MHIKISKRGKYFEVEPVGRSGAYHFGRGLTLKEAYGDFLIMYQRELDLVITVDATAQPAENGRRRRELAKR